MSALIAGLASILVFCAPGYPGATQDAQPLVDAFAQAVDATANLPPGALTAVYDPTEAGGLQKLADANAVLAFVPFPFYVQHGARLHLVVIAQADVTGVGTLEQWSLVVGKGHVTAPSGLAGYQLVSTAGYAPAFVREFALADASLPADMPIAAAPQVLSVLRRAASGAPLAVLLDGEQTASLATVPFAADLQTLAKSPPLPVALIAVVDARLKGARLDAMRAALLKLGSMPQHAQTLAALRLRGFIAPQLPAQPLPP